jgi:hypothetical protein
LSHWHPTGNLHFKISFAFLWIMLEPLLQGCA